MNNEDDGTLNEDKNDGTHISYPLLMMKQYEDIDNTLTGSDDCNGTEISLCFRFPFLINFLIFPNISPCRFYYLHFLVTYFLTLQLPISASQFAISTLNFRIPNPISLPFTSVRHETTRGQGRSPLFLLYLRQY